MHTHCGSRYPTGGIQCRTPRELETDPADRGHLRLHRRLRQRQPWDPGVASPNDSTAGPDSGSAPAIRSSPDGQPRRPDGRTGSSPRAGARVVLAARLRRVGASTTSASSRCRGGTHIDYTADIRLDRSAAARSRRSPAAPSEHIARNAADGMQRALDDAARDRAVGAARTARHEGRRHRRRRERPDGGLRPAPRAPGRAVRGARRSWAATSRRSTVETPAARSRSTPASSSTTSRRIRASSACSPSSASRRSRATCRSASSAARAASRSARAAPAASSPTVAARPPSPLAHVRRHRALLPRRAGDARRAGADAARRSARGSTSAATAAPSANTSSSRSCPPCGRRPRPSSSDFPVDYLLRFLDNHGLIGFGTVAPVAHHHGGSMALRRAHRRRLPAGAVRSGDPVVAVTRDVDGATVRTAAGRRDGFDAVVMATHADDALRSCWRRGRARASRPRRLRVHDQRGRAAHRRRLLPARRRAWGSWNIETADCRRPAEQLTMTYHMNRLQRCPARPSTCVSVNPGDGSSATSSHRRSRRSATRSTRSGR